MNIERLGERLRMAREQAGLTQTEAARSLGVTPSAMNQYEFGKRRIGALALERLAHIYAVPVRYFFADTELVEPEWEEALRSRAEGLATAGKLGMTQLIERVRDYEYLYRRTETPFPGRDYHHPFPPLRTSPVTKGDAARWAEKVRRVFAIELAPLPELRDFVEAEGFSIFSVPFGDGQEDISGLFFMHPDLGPIMAVNADQNHRRRPFTIAHELCHGLFHYDRPAILCRSIERDAAERFADRFAAYFLVPAEALRSWLEDQQLETVASVEEVVRLARYFGISFQAMRRRLAEERLLSVSEKELANVQPNVLAKTLGYRVREYELNPRLALPPEERLPRAFLSLAYAAARNGQISASRVAAMIGISELELEEQLSPELEQASEPEELYAW